MTGRCVKLNDGYSALFKLVTWQVLIIKFKRLNFKSRLTKEGTTRESQMN